MGEAVCLQCRVPFTRRLWEIQRSPRHFCGRACRDAAARVGHAMKRVICCGCLDLFMKLASEVKRCEVHYCSAPCYRKHVDRVRLGAKSGGRPKRVDPEVAFIRARKGGLARAAALSAARLSEIGRLGRAAQAARPPGAPRSIPRLRSKVARRAGPVVVLGVRLGRCVANG